MSGEEPLFFMKFSPISCYIFFLCRSILFSPLFPITPQFIS